MVVLLRRLSAVTPAETLFAALVEQRRAEEGVPAALESLRLLTAPACPALLPSTLEVMSPNAAGIGRDIDAPSASCPRLSFGPTRSSGARAPWHAYCQWQCP